MEHRPPVSSFILRRARKANAVVSKEDIEKVAAQVEKENSLFASKACLDTLAPEGARADPVGREDRAGELVRALTGGLAQGYAPAFVFVYGRTGSGKSTVVRFVCESLPVAHRLVNLRRARTVYGCASLILEELGGSPKSGQTIDFIMERIAEGLGAAAGKGGLFVLVLDEFDVLLGDKRGRPSDFIYKLLAVQQKLRERGRIACVAAISNNVMAADELDDRVRSRMGSAPEVFFDAYARQEILAILEDRAKKAFARPVDPAVIDYCAELSSQEHGDARRAIDLLRVAAEIAGLKGEKGIARAHVDMAAEKLQKDRVEQALSHASYHQRAACAGLVRITFLMQGHETWYPTSTLYRQYCMLLRKDVRPLTYRRVAELLVELENVGLAVSRAGSKGRHGYGRQYRLAVPPEAVGTAAFAEWWKILVEQKRKHEDEAGNYAAYADDLNRPKGERAFYRGCVQSAGEEWKEFVGL